MLCSSSVIFHGVEWTVGFLAWPAFWHPQRRRSFSGTSRETAGLYELVTSFVLLHGRRNPHQIRPRCGERENINLKRIALYPEKCPWIPEEKNREREWKKFARICKWNAAACHFGPHPNDWIDGVCVWCAMVEEFRLLCDHLLWPKTRLGGNSSFYSVWLNVELIFNIWHFTQIIRPKTRPWGIFADCFLSTSATVELLFLEKGFELDGVITSDGCGHPDLERLCESDIMIVEPC